MASRDLSHICNPHCSSQQHQILNSLSKARDPTRNFMVTGQICFCCATIGTLFIYVRATPAAYGSSQIRGRNWSHSWSLHHSRSNTGSEPCLQPTPQLTATLDPQPTEQGQGSNPQLHGSQLDSFLLHHDGNSSNCFFKIEI